MGDIYLLHDEDALKEVAVSAAREAHRQGFGEVLASVNESAGLKMTARCGRPDAMTKDGAQKLTVQLYDNGRLGVASSSALTREAIRTTVARAAALAREVEADSDAKLADTDWLAWESASVPLFAPSGLDAAALAKEARAIDEAVQGANLRVLDAGATSHDFRSALAIGRDFCRSESSSLQARWCVVLAEREGAMVRDYWSVQERQTSALPAPADIAQKAVSRATRKLGARSLTPRTAPVLLDAPVATRLVGELVAALAGLAQYQHSSFLTGSLGRQALADHLDLHEDPFEPFGLASGAFDGEGVAGQRRNVVVGGIIEGYFLTSLAARKLGMGATGNNNGCWNLTLSSQKATDADDLTALLRRLHRGLWVTELIGGRLDPVTGAYSKAAAGFWVENGAVAYPVQDIAIAGNMKDMLLRIDSVGRDIHRENAIRTGSILIDAMQIAGH